MWLSIWLLSPLIAWSTLDWKEGIFNLKQRVMHAADWSFRGYLAIIDIMAMFFSDSYVLNITSFPLVKLVNGFSAQGYRLEVIRF